MRFIPLHTKNTAIVYKNSLCSSAAIIVFIFVLLSVMIPVLLVSLLSPYSGISNSRILYEQPTVRFTFQYLFLGELAKNGIPVACSTFIYFNRRTEDFQKNCDIVKFSEQDHDDDYHMDRADFQIHFDNLSTTLQSFNLLLIFETTLTTRCPLTPPGTLTHSLRLPNEGLQHGVISMKGRLKLSQKIAFMCPFYGRNIKTHFNADVLPTNTSSMAEFRFDHIRNQIKANAAFFELVVEETSYKQTEDGGLALYLQIDIEELASRYNLSVWERLGQFWLYFASFFGISFYVMNKLKDFLFGKRILRAWEVIPWKKLY